MERYKVWLENKQTGIFTFLIHLVYNGNITLFNILPSMIPIPFHVNFPLLEIMMQIIFWQPLYDPQHFGLHHMNGLKIWCNMTFGKASHMENIRWVWWMFQQGNFMLHKKKNILTDIVLYVRVLFWWRTKPS